MRLQGGAVALAAVSLVSLRNMAGWPLSGVLGRALSLNQILNESYNIFCYPGI